MPKGIGYPATSATPLLRKARANKVIASRRKKVKKTANKFTQGLA